jgi:hypothetical protein
MLAKISDLVKMNEQKHQKTNVVYPIKMAVPPQQMSNAQSPMLIVDGWCSFCFCVPCKGGWLGANERARGIYSLPSFSNVVFVVEYSGEERREGTRGLFVPSISIPPQGRSQK